MSSRESFLQRVREAVQAGNRPGTSAALEPRCNVGYQGAGADPVARFRDELTTAGGQPHLVANRAAAVDKVLELVQARSARSVLLGDGAILESLGIAAKLRAAGTEVVAVGDLTAENRRGAFFAADVGISGVDYLVAETGSVALLTKPADPRSLSLLPPVHIAVAERAQIVADLFDLFAVLPAGNHEVRGSAGMPACVSLITGPSKTGDIELRLVTGVHGPGEIHVVVITV